MNFKKLILPMLVLVCAIAMAFTTKDLKEPQPTQAQDYILFNGSWRAIDEQDCEGTGYTCRVKYTQNGTEYDVYDEMNDELPKESASNEATLINP